MVYNLPIISQFPVASSDRPYSKKRVVYHQNIIIRLYCMNNAELSQTKALIMTYKSAA